MFFESAEVSVETVDSIATLWLKFPGRPVNALTPSRWQRLAQAFCAVQRRRDLDALVIRSRLPAGFCGGQAPGILAELKTETDISTFARIGQSTLQMLDSLPFPTVAFIEGPCLGPGLELALACDFRLAVARPDSWFAFPDWRLGLPPVWGGVARLSSRPNILARLRQGQKLTAREAVRIGLIHDAACVRRGKILLRNWLDRLQSRPRLPRRREFAEELARERFQFRNALRQDEVQKRLRIWASHLEIPAEWGMRAYPISNRPATVALLGENCLAGEWAVELSIFGHQVLLLRNSESIWNSCHRAFAVALRRGRVTPLEAEQARGRIHSVSDSQALAQSRWVIATEACPRLKKYDEELSSRTIIVLTGTAADANVSGLPWARPQRIIRCRGNPLTAVHIQPDSWTAPETAWNVAAWLETLMIDCVYATQRVSVGEIGERYDVASAARAA